jgi:hypothetical protein
MKTEAGFEATLNCLRNLKGGNVGVNDGENL